MVDVVAPLLGWNEARAAAELSAYSAHVQAQRNAEEAETDAEAAALLAGAPAVPVLTDTERA